MDAGNLDSERPQFSRTPGRDIFGKLDGHLPEVRVSLDVEADAKRAAAAAGLDISSWLRLLVYGSLYTAEHIATLHADQVRRVLGNAGQPTSEFIELRVVDGKKGQGVGNS